MSSKLFVFHILQCRFQYNNTIGDTILIMFFLEIRKRKDCSDKFLKNKEEISKGFFRST